MCIFKRYSYIESMSMYAQTDPPWCQVTFICETISFLNGFNCYCNPCKPREHVHKNRI